MHIYINVCMYVHIYIVLIFVKQNVKLLAYWVVEKKNVASAAKNLVIPSGSVLNHSSH